MAAGGTARASVKGSDEFYPFMCSPCSRNDLDIGAEVYCLQCEEYLCGKCLGHHNKFAKMAAHTMLDRAQMEAKGPQKVQPLLTVPCDLHPGQVYTLLCEKHDQVCCAVCSPIHHKSCDVKYILNVAQRAMKSPVLNEFKRSLKGILMNLEKVKKQRELDMQRITEEKDTQVKEIRASIQQLIKQLEQLEASAIDDVSRKFTEFKAKIDSDLATLDTAITRIDTKLDKLEKANDNTEKFVHMKICEGDKVNAMIRIKDIEARTGEEQLVFLIDKRVEESVRRLPHLGQLVTSYRYTVTPEGQHRVNTKKDKDVCDINSICIAEDGTLVMTDFNNEYLKKLDQRYKVTDRLKIDDELYGVCLVPTGQAAVCLRKSKTVQLVVLNPNMSKSSSFKTTDSCRGIAYHADHLYVACGGGLESKDKGPGHIAVYSISGTLLRTFQEDTQGKLFTSIPLCVAVRSSDGVILVCDKFNGLVALRPDGQRLWMVTCKDLEVEIVNDIRVDRHGQALVSGLRSNKVVMVSMNGRKMGTVLTARDGINKPRPLCLDEKRSHLIVGMGVSNQFSVFELA